MTSESISLNNKLEANGRNRARTGRLLAIGAVGAFGLSRLLRERGTALHSAATTLTDTVSAPGTHEEPFLGVPADSPAQASGHRHLPPPKERTTTRLSHRAWRRSSLRTDHTGHPPRA